MFLRIRRYFFRRYMMRRLLEGNIPRGDAERFVDYIMGHRLADTPRGPKIMNHIAQTLIEARQYNVSVGDDIGKFLGAPPEDREHEFDSPLDDRRKHE